MSAYNSTEELETIAKATKGTPAFTNIMNLCAWHYSVYERSRFAICQYLDEHKSGRPTKEREQLQVQCSRRYGEWWSLVQALDTLAEPYGTISTSTISDEVIELLDGRDPIKARRILLDAYGN